MASRENDRLVCGLVYAVNQRLSPARPAPLLAGAVGVLAVRNDNPAGDRDPFARALLALFLQNGGLRPAVCRGAADLCAASLAGGAGRLCIVLHGWRSGGPHPRPA